MSFDAVKLQMVCQLGVVAGFGVAAHNTSKGGARIAFKKPFPVGHQRVRLTGGKL